MVLKRVVGVQGFLRGEGEGRERKGRIQQCKVRTRTVASQAARAGCSQFSGVRLGEWRAWWESREAGSRVAPRHPQPAHVQSRTVARICSCSFSLHRYALSHAQLEPATDPPGSSDVSPPPAAPASARPYVPRPRASLVVHCSSPSRHGPHSTSPPPHMQPQTPHSPGSEFWAPASGSSPHHIRYSHTCTASFVRCADLLPRLAGS